jgi:hypothetical protein
MKTMILSAVLIGLVANSFAQDIVYQSKIKKEEVPVAIIESVQTDFPGYVMEEFSAVPLEYVEDYAWVNRNIKSIDEYDTFEIDLAGKDQEITATYNRYGNLLGSAAHIKNALPPPAVRDAVAKAYPGWTITKDVYNMTQYNAGKSKERYRLEIMKDGKKMHIYADANGKILNDPKMHKKHKM